jgi:cytochrome c
MFRPILVAALLATPALAQDAGKGESEFRKCKSCHSIIAPDGTAVVKGGKTGPNLYGVIGRPLAATEFDYGAGIREAAAKGLVWDEASLATYVQNPTAWLQEVTGDPAAQSKMTFKLGKGGADVAAYLASVVP